MAKEGRTMFYKQLRGSRTDRGSQLESGREVAGSQQTQKPKAAPQRDSSPRLAFAISCQDHPGPRQPSSKKKAG